MDVQVIWLSFPVLCLFCNVPFSFLLHWNIFCVQPGWSVPQVTSSGLLSESVSIQDPTMLTIHALNRNNCHVYNMLQVLHLLLPHLESQKQLYLLVSLVIYMVYLCRTTLHRATPKMLLFCYISILWIVKMHTLFHLLEYLVQICGRNEMILEFIKVKCTVKHYFIFLSTSL